MPYKQTFSRFAYTQNSGMNVIAIYCWELLLLDFGL